MTRGARTADDKAAGDLAPVTYNYSFFHLIFALASTYIAMLMTGALALRMCASCARGTELILMKARCTFTLQGVQALLVGCQRRFHISLALREHVRHAGGCVSLPGSWLTTRHP